MTIKVELISKEPKLIFIIRGINHTIANTLRKTANEIPILAVDTVEFTKNDSVLYDEFLAHRIGLFPLENDRTLTAQEECSCEGKGCGKCTVNLTLKAQGPGIVYAKELKGRGVKVIYPDMPLVILQKGQEVELIAAARLGKGKEHTKFSPGLVYYGNYPIFTMKPCSLCGACVDACPPKILGIDEKSKKISVKDEHKCDLCMACVEACAAKGEDAIKVEANKEDFIFMIESWGQISSKEIFAEIIKTLNANLKALEKEIEKSVK